MLRAMRAILHHERGRGATAVGLAALTVGLCGAGDAAALTARETDYQDWRVRCETPDGGSEQCMMFQSVGSDERPGRLLNIAVRYLPDQPVALAQISVPLGVYLPNGLVIQIDDRNPLRIPFEYCNSGGCTTRIQLQDDILGAMKAGQQMTVEIVQFINAKKYYADISLKGFTAAFGALK